MSWKQPVLTAEFAAVGVTALLESIREVDRGIRFYQASSSEIFGEPRRGAADGGDRRLRRDAVRRREGLRRTSSRAATGALRAARLARGSSTTTSRPGGRSTSSRARSPTPRPRSASGSQGELWLGDLDARRDWGYAGDYVRAMWLMLQQDEPDDYVIATGEPHSVRELVEVAFGHVGLDWQEYVQIDESLGAARPSCTTSSATRRRRARSWLGADGRASRARPAARRRRSRSLGARAAGATAGPGSKPVLAELPVDGVVPAGTLVPGEARGAPSPLRRVARVFRTSRMACAIASGRSGRSSAAASPQISGSGATRETATGQPQAIASTDGIPKPS